ILFDQEMTGQSFYWKPAECEQFVNGQPAKPFSLSGDVGFAFGSAVLTQAGLDTVGNIASQLKDMPNVNAITVSGHTDRIGNADANQQLSQQRAQAVRTALVNQGLPAGKIQAQGFGASKPVV